MRVSPLLAVLWILSTSMVALVATAAEPTAPSATTPAAAPATAIPPGAPVRPRFDRKAFEIPHRKRVLGNGLTVLVHEDHAVPVVAVNLWYHVGSRNEERTRQDGLRPPVRAFLLQRLRALSVRLPRSHG
jgi:hypothetical protein